VWLVQAYPRAPGPVVLAPQPGLGVAAIRHEGTQLLVRDGERVDREGRDADPMDRELVVPAEGS